MIQEQILQGKIAIKLSEFKEGFFIEKHVLVVLTKERELVVCKIKSQLTVKEKKLLEKDLKSGLRKIDSKIQKKAPITVMQGEAKAAVYYDDLMIIRTENGVVTCNIVK